MYDSDAENKLSLLGKKIRVKVEILQYYSYNYQQKKIKQNADLVRAY